MQQPSECTAVFIAKADQYRLRDRAMQACRTAIANCSAEELKMGIPPLDGWVAEDIVPIFERCSVVFLNAIIDHPYFETQLGLYRGDGPLDLPDGRIGTYRLITDFGGHDEDDYLNIEIARGSV